VNAAELWTAPELLREVTDVTMRSSQSGDLYSLGLLLYSTAYRVDPYHDDDDIIPLTHKGINLPELL